MSTVVLLKHGAGEHSPGAAGGRAEVRWLALLRVGLFPMHIAFSGPAEADLAADDGGQSKPWLEAVCSEVFHVSPWAGAVSTGLGGSLLQSVAAPIVHQKFQFEVQAWAQPPKQACSGIEGASHSGRCIGKQKSCSFTLLACLP